MNVKEPKPQERVKLIGTKKGLALCFKLGTVQVAASTRKGAAAGLSNSYPHNSKGYKANGAMPASVVAGAVGVSREDRFGCRCSKLP